MMTQRSERETAAPRGRGADDLGCRRCPCRSSPRPGRGTVRLRSSPGCALGASASLRIRSRRGRPPSAARSPRSGARGPPRAAARRREPGSAGPRPYAWRSERSAEQAWSRKAGLCSGASSSAPCKTSLTCCQRSGVIMNSQNEQLLKNSSSLDRFAFSAGHKPSVGFQSSRIRCEQMCFRQDVGLSDVTDVL